MTDSILYEDGKDIMHVSFSYHPNGKLRERELNDSRTKTTELTLFYDDGIMERNTMWVNGTGNQVYYYQSGQVKKVERYKNKKIISADYFKQDGTAMTEKEARKIEEKNPPDYKKYIEENKTIPGMPPSYPGGPAGFSSFFSRNFKPPQNNSSQPLESVTVTFYLDKAGFAKDIKVSGSSNRDLEIEIQTVFRRMSPWNMNGHESYGPIKYTINLSGY